MKNTKLKALVAAFLLAILPTALSVACSVEDPTPDSPTPAPTPMTVPTSTLTPEPLRHADPDPPTTGPKINATSTPPPSTPVPQPTGLQATPPVVGIDTGKGTVFVDPELLSIIAKHAAGDDRASGQLRVLLGWDETDIPLNNFLIGQGGVRETDTYNPDFLHANLIWRIPVESTLTVIQHPGVRAAELWEDGQTERRERPRHPKLEETANLIVTAWQLGVPDENAAQYAIFVRGDRVLVWIYAENGPDFETLIAWLESEGIYLIDKVKEPTRDGDGNIIQYSTGGMVPVRIIAEAIQREDVLGIKAEDYSGQGLEMQRHYWPPSTLQHEKALETWPESQYCRDRRFLSAEFRWHCGFLVVYRLKLCRIVLKYVSLA